jgi:hypothetical protein
MLKKKKKKTDRAREREREGDAESKLIKRFMTLRRVNSLV